MKILLIGNFAPPFEEESLHNISLYRKLREDGHECTVMNISTHPATDGEFMNASGNAGYFFKLLRHSLNKDVIHFMTKGYLRVGLLKLMLAVFAGTVFRVRKILTIHSEFFSILGQMRSPFGGTQTLNTSFFLADRIIFTDRDTFDSAKIYMKKSNFELVPSFIHMPEDMERLETRPTKKMRNIENILFFANVQHPSFLFDSLFELVRRNSLPHGTGIVIALSDKPSLKLQHGIEDISGSLRDRIIFIEYDDTNASLIASFRAKLILKPMSCDGESFFESFAMSARKTFRRGNFIYFPNSLLFIKEGQSGGICAEVIKTMLSEEPDPSLSLKAAESYARIIEIYRQ